MFPVHWALSRCPSPVWVANATRVPESYLVLPDERFPLFVFLQATLAAPFPEALFLGFFFFSIRFFSG
jgi:hypothetical protein